MKKFSILLLLIFLLLNISFSSEIIKLKKSDVVKLLKLPLKCINKEFPYKPSHVLYSPEDLQLPKRIHPSFYGCFDWHSSVHGHWLLVYILKNYKNLKQKEEIIKKLENSFNPYKIKKEAEYILSPKRKTFERMYGWAWLLKLTEELYSDKSPVFKRWRKNLSQLEKAIVKRYLNFLPKLSYPIRVGVHPNTAFALSFGYDYAIKTKNFKLKNLIVKKAKEFYLTDKNYPANLEPGGEDFFSPALLEAELMSKILNADDFKKWFSDFLPDLKYGKPENIFTPAKITDRSDPKIVHLDGLNFNRAWCFFAISKKSNDKKLKNILINAAVKHFKASFPYIVSGEYGGEHWLATFAFYAYKMSKCIN